jgi:hypothetical protein
MAITRLRWASVSFDQVASVGSIITSSFDFSFVLRKYARFFACWQKLVHPLAYRKQVHQQKASFRQSDYWRHLICPVQWYELALAIGELDFEQRAILFPLMLYDGKGLPSQRMSGMGDTHDSGMCWTWNNGQTPD